ncbi:response regulator [Dactylosporangium sp. CS-047395]|uniref:response regulator n=1 Tax=Dactylosporangium sp. CS-047395 TaxID=3239936 RepID=UPI003D927B78
MATVLIGENVPDLGQALRLIFTRAGHEVRATVTGDETLRSACAEPPDLIVMNPTLPGFDGLEVCRMLRADPRTSRVPILMLSVHQQPGDLAAAHAAGADEFRGKPFDNRELLACAEGLMARTA